MALKLYQLFTTIASPLIDLYLLHRKRTGKEDVERFEERLGRTNFPRPKGTLLWIHAASVGESLSVLPLINKLSASNAELNILFTTGTKSSAKIIENRLPDKAFHQYIPVDRISAVKRFLKHWRPNLVLWVESELWPNLVSQTSKQCPMILINGRISDDSYQKWQKYKSLGEHVLSRFSLILPQSKHDLERFKKLGAKNLKLIGNLKFDSPPLPYDSKKTGELVSTIGQHHVWLAASTHAGEEKIIASIHKELKENHPDILTIIAPRHPARMEEIVEEITEFDLNVSVRSKGELITNETDIYIADTLGELGIFYRLSPIVFIGGTLVEHGGQNPLEAARLDCSILFGPHMDNFIEVKREFEEKEAAICIKDKEGLKDSLDGLLNDYEKQSALAKAALNLVEEKSGIVDSYISDISLYLDKISVAKHETA